MNEPYAVLLLLGVIALASFQGHRDELFQERWIFDAERIRLRREYHRFLSSGALHADLRHFVFNAITIYFFGRPLEYVLGPLAMLTIFVGSVIGGSLLSYCLSRGAQHRALGASGGACGLIFAYILLFPGSSVSLGFVPVFVPAWIYGILFVGLSYWAHHRKQDNIGHDAHLGGAAFGVMLLSAYRPAVWFHAPLTTWLSLGLLLAICAYLAFRPHGFGKHELIGSTRRYSSNLRYQRYDEAAILAASRRRLDELLDKLGTAGPAGLKPREQAELEELSRKLRPRSPAPR